MKLSTVLCALVAGVLFVSCASTSGGGKVVEVFDGQSLAGWSHVLVDDSVDMKDVWRVEDGVLICKGEPLGYLYTKESFKDYHLVVEWRWAPGTKPGNSGVLLRIAGDPITFLPRCVEAQLQSGSAGDIWAFYGAHIRGDSERAREVKAHKDLGDFMGVGKIKAAEKPAGEWNRYEIDVMGDSVELRVNGELVNQATGMDILAGPIGLQSEGGEIHFRRVQVTKK